MNLVLFFGEKIRTERIIRRIITAEIINLYLILKFTVTIIGAIKSATRLIVLMTELRVEVTINNAGEKPMKIAPAKKPARVGMPRINPTKTGNKMATKLAMIASLIVFDSFLNAWKK